MAPKNIIALLSLALAVLSAHAAEKRSVVILIWPNVELLDFAGPAEVFSSADQHQCFDVHLVSVAPGPVATQNSTVIQPEFTIENSPKADVLVIPGGRMKEVRENPAVVAWVKKNAAGAEIVMSTCSGALLLAEAGLLDGLSATTHRLALDKLEQSFPKVHVVRTDRYIDNGKIITTGGVTAGIDGALHVVDRLYGRAAAEWTARDWMEYRGDYTAVK